MNQKVQEVLFQKDSQNGRKCMLIRNMNLCRKVSMPLFLRRITL